MTPKPVGDEAFLYHPVRVQGIHRSCTNIVEYIIRENFGIDYPQPHSKFKHRILPEYNAAHIFIAAKNPFAWLHSYAKFKGKKLDIKFLTSPIKVGGVVSPTRPLNFYNNLYKHWLTDIPKYMIIRHEDLVSYPIRTVYQIRAFCGLPTTDQFPCYTYNRMTTDAQPIKTSNFNNRGYRQKLYMKPFTDEMIEFVRKRINWNIIEEMEYEEYFV